MKFLTQNCINYTYYIEIVNINYENKLQIIFEKGIEYSENLVYDINRFKERISETKGVVSDIGKDSPYSD